MIALPPRRAAGCLVLSVAAVMLGGGCTHFVHPDPRDFAVNGIQNPTPDVAASAALANAPPPPGRTPDPGPQPGPPANPDGPGPSPASGVLALPPQLPGAATPPLTLPKMSGLPADERARIIKDKYPALPPLDAEPPFAPSPTGQPLTLAELEQMALANNPLIKQAAADIEAARGAAIQAGLLPNPEAGYQVDQLNSGRGYTSRGQQGGYVSWVVKTAGKLRLARLVEVMGYVNAQVALRRAQVDLVGQVRANYFAVLVARESMSVNRALTRFSDDIYRAQLSLVQGGEQAAYEPLQSYVLAVQARGTLVQSRNRAASAWRQLAANLGQPALPPAALAGQADAPVPEFALEPLREQILANHTDILTAQNAILQNRYRSQLAKVTAIPDFKMQVYIEKDWSTPPFNTQLGIQAGGAMPIFDRNQGGRVQAHAQLARAIQDVSRAQNDLSGRLAQAFELYSNNKVLVGYYRDQAIPNQVRVYRAVYRRFTQEPGQVNYNDVVLAQQTLATTLNSYLTFLGSQWSAVVDLATLAQTDELYVPTGGTGVAACLDAVTAPGEPAPAAAPPPPLVPAPVPVPPAPAAAPINWQPAQRRGS